MTARLEVRAIREALWGKSTRDENKARSNALLGKIFHEIAAALTNERSPHHIADLLQDAPTEGEPRNTFVRRAVYEKLVGPKLAAVQAQLGASAEEVLAFWTAVQELVDWLLRLTDVVVETGCTLERAKPMFASEEPMRVTLREPAWTDDVEIAGILDLVIRVPAERPALGAPSEEWCVIELKLGRGAPEADFGQVSLYHLLLHQLGRAPGSLALVSFGPARKEILLGQAELTRVRGPLLELVGKLAGVLPKPEAPKPEAPKPEAPKPELGELTTKLTRAFREYGVDVKLGAPMIGPTFYRFPVELGRGQAVEKLRSNTANVQLRVGLREAPLVAVDRGRLMIDVERADRRAVPFAEVRAQITGAKKSALLPIGVDYAGTLRFADLGDPLNSHVLVAGTTGSGKSEWLRFALAGVALKATPDEVRFLLIDPKRTAFTELKGSPYLYGGDRGLVFPDEHPVVEVLAELGDEMDRRYALFEKSGADDLATYEPKLPRILVVCDEYADLVAGGGKTQKAIEAAISRLGAKARAAGIHLILATQQPSRQIMRGAIQTNIPCRVGLKTQKAIESQMLLNQPGAEALLGHGDLLFKDIGDPVRLQSPLTTRDERRAIFHPNGLGRASSPSQR